MEDIVIGFLAGVLLALFGIFAVSHGTESAIRKEAVEAGAGHYVIIDPTSGVTEFQWINQTNQPAQ
jgi:hypothetical protein